MVDEFKVRVEPMSQLVDEFEAASQRSANHVILASRLLIGQFTEDSRLA